MNSVVFVKTVEESINDIVFQELTEIKAKGITVDNSVITHYTTYRRMTLAMETGRYQRLCEQYGDENAEECVVFGVPEWWYQHKPSFHMNDQGFPDEIYDFDNLSEDDKAIMAADYWADVRKRRALEKRRWLPCTGSMNDAETASAYAEYQEVKKRIQRWRWSHDAAWLRLVEKYVNLSRELSLPNALLIADLEKAEIL